MKKSKIIRVAVLLFSAVMCLVAPEWMEGRRFEIYAASVTASDPPNIILILTDDQDIESIAFMPHLQALLIDRGMTFTHYFANVPLCCPARVSTLRGQYAHNHQVLTNRSPDGGFEKFRDLGHESSTVATWLQDAGYRTVLIGKYLNGYPAGNQTYVPPGWDEWYGLVSGLYVNYQLNENGQVVAYDSRQQNYETDVLTRKATDFIRRMAPVAPFFIYLVPNAPHAPITPAPRHQNEFAGVMAPRPPSFNESDVSDKPAWVQNLLPLTADDISQIDEDYRERLRSLLAVDDMIRSIVDTLAALNELDQTYIFFSSDNGFHQGDHRIVLGKNTTYEESIHLPLIVRGPGVPAGEVQPRLASVIDLAPTFAELAVAETPEFVDGRSLVPLLNSASPPGSWRTAVLVEHWVNRDEGIPEFQGLRSSSQIYVEYDTNEREFYDLQNDPFELENVHATTDGALLAQFAARLDSLRQCAGADCFPSDEVPLQPTVRGWYADGQVWITWDLDDDPAETYGIYASPTPFTNIDQAQLIGRLYQEEWLPYALRTQLGAPTATFVIPDGRGGQLTLPQNMGLFVETVHESGSTYYAVVKWGETGVTNNITPQAVSYTFSTGDPVECHLQTFYVSLSGHKITTYYMWADGRDNHWEGRPDFPIMANHHKNGMPSFFIVSEAKNLPAGNVSAVHWLHGGGGTASQSLPTTRTAINIEPQDGLLVAHNDDFFRRVLVNGVPTKVTEHSNSWFFGWAKNHNPFEATQTIPVESDTIINYTQRRLIWINDWLIRNRDVDPERVAIQGHSMGAAGTTALAKVFPNKFATACIFNNGFGGPEPGDQGELLFGTSEQNRPTNLVNRKGETVLIYDVFNLSTPTALERDM
ncbi:MAG TPA: sulfatase, partial [bacterium]